MSEEPITDASAKWRGDVLQQRKQGDVRILQNEKPLHTFRIMG
jgi:hypothetical protein